MSTLELEAHFKQYGEEHGRFQLLTFALNQVVQLGTSENVRRAEFLGPNFKLTIRRTDKPSAPQPEAQAA